MLEVFWISIIFMFGIVISWKTADYFELKNKINSEHIKENEIKNQ